MRRIAGANQRQPANHLGAGIDDPAPEYVGAESAIVALSADFRARSAANTLSTGKERVPRDPPAALVRKQRLLRPERRKGDLTKRSPFLGCMSGGVLLSHTVAGAVPSALKGLASGFGMGPGVSPSL